MTSIRLQHHGKPAVRSSTGASAVRKALLLAGVLSSILYVLMDLGAASLYPGYSIRDQAISELSAIGAPTARLWSMLSPVYGVLFFCFAIGVFRADAQNRWLRRTSGLLMLLALSGILWTFFPMQQRGNEINWQGAGHIAMGAYTVLLIVTFMGTGALALGHRFRRFSLLTMFIAVTANAPLFLWTGRVARDEPTPWLGFLERLGMYAFLVWIAVLAIALFRRPERESFA